VGIKSSEASLQAVRLDLDLGLDGGMLERAVRSKANQRTGNVSLAKFKGNICGQQNQINSNPLNNQYWDPLRWETAAAYYISKQGDVSAVGDSHYWISIREGGFSFGDRGTETRLMGRVLESGTYRATCRALGRFDTQYNVIGLHFDVVANSTGYLQGAQEVPCHIEERWTDPSKTFNWSRTFTLSTSKPYITVICRNIAFDGGLSGRTYQSDFYDTLLEKV
jgi:hypothetical protein